MYREREGGGHANQMPHEASTNPSSLHEMFPFWQPFWTRRIYKILFYLWFLSLSSLTTHQALFRRCLLINFEYYCDSGSSLLLFLPLSSSTSLCNTTNSFSFHNLFCFKNRSGTLLRRIFPYLWYLFFILQTTKSSTVLKVSFNNLEYLTIIVIRSSCFSFLTAGGSAHWLQ